MQGTPYQRRWALSIRAEKLRIIDPELDAMHARGAVEAVAATRAELMRKSATWWIDRRRDDPLQLLALAGFDARNKADRTSNYLDQEQ